MKKGFTLIEILAVIIVLAIVSVIAAPSLIGVINKSRLNALKSSAYGLINASNLYYTQYQNSQNIRFDINDNIATSSDTSNKLKYKGNIKEGTTIIKSNGQTVVCVTDGKNSAYKNYNESKVSLISGKACSIPSSTSIVYLDGEATLTELSNQELTDLVQSLKEDVDNLKNENSTLKNQISTLRTDIDASTKLDEVYPVGSIYMSVNNINPSTLFGGTWTKLEGRFLLGSSSSYALGSTGGNTSVSYTPQGTVGNTTLTVNQIPSHTHTLTTNGRFTIGNGNGSGISGIPSNTAGWGTIGNADWYVLSIDKTGGSQAHNHSFTGTQTSIQTMPPYIVVNVWKRTA